ncbi:hypothetical protein [Novosphingobium aquimarinum]|uniref:hypothetical protein n=1 Tax=Novosphingobium aquimarinum TaxID=2682494 RepID=UPI0012EBD352|nr:hypothetical protein [Novosphingobium aquimarinum]
MNLAGTYNCTAKTPLGDQNFVFAVMPGDDGERFTGTVSGDLGSMAVTDGRIENGTLFWSMKLTQPMPLSLDCEATVAGDALDGTVKAGFMGSFPVKGTRQG